MDDVFSSVPDISFLDVSLFSCWFIRINLQSYTKNPTKILIGIYLYLEINYISLLLIDLFLGSLNFCAI